MNEIEIQAEVAYRREHIRKIFAAGRSHAYACGWCRKPFSEHDRRMIADGYPVSHGMCGMCQRQFDLGRVPVLLPDGVTEYRSGTHERCAACARYCVPVADGLCATCHTQEAA